MPVKVLVTIDASDLVRQGNTIWQVASMTPKALEAVLDQAAKKRVRLIRRFTPSQKRKDPRHPLKLRDSYDILKARGKRTIVTLEPNKYTWVTEGTRPPSGGSGIILPRLKKALYWPQIRGGRPVAVVYRHPGIRQPNRFVERAMQGYYSTGGDDSLLAVLVNGIVIGIISGIGELMAAAGMLLMPVSKLIRQSGEEN